LTSHDLETRAAFEALQTSHRNLEDAIAGLLQIALRQPEGPLRNELMDRVSCLDSIADVMKRIIGQNCAE